MTSSERLRQAVDLYRGEVGFTLPIVTLPGRGGPDAVLAAVYGGSVGATVTRNNTVAPTGVLGLGWSLSRSAIVAAPDGAGYVLVGEDGAGPLVQTGVEADGTLLYAALDYRFWIIRRRPGSERWEITREDGSRAVYGDIAGNRGTVDWGVAWGDWTGASKSLDGQRLVAVGWSLSQVFDLWGNVVTYAYDQVIDLVGGPNGLPYTRATYLSSITGAGGDVARLTYGEKAVNECPPLHVDPQGLNAWQDRWETRYLASVSVFAPGGKLMGVTTFDFEGGSGQTQYVGQGTLAKRLLMGIVAAAPGATPPPPFSFTYVTDAASKLLGTMATAQTPEGAKATYAYAAAGMTAGLSARDLTLAPPTRSGVTFSQPLFYFAETYVVATWLGSDASVQAVAYRWVGRWVATQLASVSLGATAYGSVAVGLAADTFCIAANGKLLAYVASDTVVGGWNATASALTLSLTAGEAVTAVCGSGFAAVVGQASGKLNLAHWNGAAWVADTLVQLAGTAGALCANVAAEDRRLLAVSVGTGAGGLTAVLMSLDPFGRWTSISRPAPRPLPSISAVSVVLGDGYGAYAASGGPTGAVQVACTGVAWPADVSRLDLTPLVVLGLAASAAVPGLVIRGATVGLGGQLFRYQGSGWSRYGSDAIVYPGEQAVTGISYGFDMAVRTMTGTGGSPLFDLAAYDPGAGTWSVPAAFAGAAPTGGNFVARAAVSPRTPSRYAVFPIVNGATWSNGVYFQGPTGAWTTALSVTDTLTTAETTSLQVLGESCCVYQTGTKTVVYPLLNGAAVVSARIDLTGQKVLVPSGTGRELVGPSSFVTYSGTWGASAVLTLRRMVGNLVAGQQAVPALATTALNDGYAVQTLAIAGASATATVTADGWRAAYNQTTVAEGTTDVGVAPNGTTVTWFFNGLTAQDTPSQPYPTGTDTNAATLLGVMAGQVYGRMDRSAGTGSPPPLTNAGTTTFYLWGYAQALSSVAGDSRSGFYVRQRRLARVLDGVTSTVRTSYSANDSTPPATGLPTVTATDRYNASGQLETLTQTPLYIWQQYAATRALNILTPVVQTTEATNGTTTAISIETWRNDWPTRPGVWAPSATFQALSVAPAAFNWTTGTGAAASWLPGVTVTQRSARGVPVVTVDALGRYSGAVRDADDLLTTAAFVNAQLDQAEAGYYGCEPYEADPYWSYAGGGALSDHIVTTQAHTGTSSIQIDPAAGVKSGPAATFLRTAGSRAYLFSSWLLTDPGFGAAAGTARWELQVYTAVAAPAAVGAPIQLTMPDTAGKWAYLHQIIDLAAVRAANPSVPAGTPLTVGLIGYNQKTGKRCWVDELRFSPLDAAYEAAVFDPATLLPSATLGPNGQTTRQVRDAARNVTAVVGPAENVVGTTSFTYARSLTSGGVFDPNLPNSQLSIGGLADGVYYDFDPSDKADWTLPDAFWDVTNRQLVYSGSTTPPAFSQATLTAFVHGNYAMKVDVQRNAPGGGAPLANVRIGMGNVYVAWDEAAATWTLYAPTTPGGAASAMAVRTGRFARTWIFAAVEELVLFYADGQQVFCDQLPGLVRGDGRLILGLSGPGAFADLVCPVEPQISLGLFDGAGKPMQTLSVVDGHTVVAGGTLYDSQQRPQYGKDPISNPLMIGAGPGTTPPPPSTAEQNRLIGDIDSYLPYVAGQPMSVAQYTAPANGYPFTQSRYETAPTARVLEEGAPGTSYAVGSGHTYRYAYGANTATDPLTPLLPAGSAGRTPGSYAVVTVTDPNNVVSYRLVNQSNQTLAVRTRTGGTDAAPVYQTTMWLYDAAGRLVTVQLPNYFSPPSGSTAAPWVIQYVYDFVGRLVSQTTPDAGQTQYAYDSAGRLRFAMDADGAAQSPQRFKYFQYDGLNRVTQSGLVQQAGLTWAGLAAYVDQPAWPAPGTGVTIYGRNTYDADGAGTDNLEARLWRGTVDNGAAGLTTDALSYDRRGNIMSRKTTASGYGATTYQSAALYNNLDLPIMTTYPQALDGGGQPTGTAFQVTYFYDRLGQLAGVGQPPAGGEVLDPEHPRGGPEIYYASYYYNSMGEVTQASLNDNNLGAPISRGATYNSAGWPTMIGGDFYAEGLTYDQGGFNGKAYYNGQIASASSTYAAEPGLDPWTAPPTSQRQWAYQYDALGRLQVADPGASADTANAALAIGSATTPVSYDANGNLLNVPRGPTTEQYSYLTGVAPNQVWNNNRVQSVAAAVQSTIQFAAATTYPGWTWGASNGGPSASTVAAPTGTETLPPGQALQLVGGSPGHAETLQFVGFLAMGGTYQLSYWLKTPDPFAAQPGPATWSLQLSTDVGEIVDAPIKDIGAGSTTWTQVTGVTIDTQTIAASMGLDGHVVSIALVLTNGKSSGTSAAGASLFVADVSITGSASAGQYGYASPNGWVTSATSRQLASLSYSPLTGLTTGATVTGARACTVTYAYGQGTDRSVGQWTAADGSVAKVLDLRGPDGQPLARRTTRQGAESVTYFLYGAEGLLATVPAEATTTTRYTLSDHLGSVRAVVDQTGKLLQSYDYGPFGELLEGPAAPLQPEAYAGQPIDEAIRLSNYQARLYDPALRRFYAPDPAGEGASSYAYVGNDPINATDPSGMFLRRLGGHVGAHPYIYGTLGVLVAAGVGAVRTFTGFLARPDFYDTDFGKWWQGYSDLSNWPQSGRVTNMVNRILHNFSRDELITMTQYFPFTYPVTTPLAWALIYKPVDAAVNAAYHGGGNGQTANAIRHVTWMCSAQRFLWQGDAFANALGEAHERGRKGDIRDQVSDRINNAIALYLAANSSESCGAIAAQAWKDNILAWNHEYDRNSGDVAAHEQAITTSWIAGLKYLADKPQKPLFEPEDLDELKARGIDYP